MAAEKKTELALKSADNELTRALDFYARQGELTAGEAEGFSKLFKTGEIVANLNALLTPKVMESIMWLQNNPIGFLTDRKGAGYSMDEVKTCIIQAGFEGVQAVGNQFNIIAGRLYITKNGMAYKLKHVPGLRYHVTPGIPKAAGQGGAICPVHLEWTLNGEKFQNDMEFAIRVNNGMGADAIIGKATRKAYAWLWEEVTGNAAPEGEVADAAPAIDVTPKESPLEKTAQENAQDVQEIPQELLAM